MFISLSKERYVEKAVQTHMRIVMQPRRDAVVKRTAAKQRKGV